MRAESDIEKLLKTIKTKIAISDYDLGVQATLLWMKGEASPFDGRADDKVQM
jgi:hypothetical protein